MQWLSQLLTWIANNLFNQVAILIGLIALVGYALQRRRTEEVVAGALRATIGVLILFVGIDVFVGGLVSFQTILSSAFGLRPPQAAKTLGDFLQERGGSVALIIAIGFLIHVVLVRLVPAFRYVYLTGHLMFWISVVVAAVLIEAFPGISATALVLWGSVIVALYWSVQPMYIARYMRQVIGSDDWGFGHTSSAGCFLAAWLGRYVGSRETHDTERVQLPGRLSVFKDINAANGIVIGAIMLLGIAFADKALVLEQARKFSQTIDPWVWGIVVGLRFAAGIAILLFGVRMFLAEIVPAFKGISDRIIPGSKPALDVPTVFPMAPTAVLIGFLSGTVVFLILMGVFGALGWFTLVPPMIMLFFPGGGAGVFGNAFGGWRGAVLGGVINGLFLAIGQATAWGLLSHTAPELATLGDPDWYILIWVLRLVLAPFAGS
ncbi:MAG: PTS ascorbate transporter subunit IIC [Armatimonadota bacterium]|nr:PTS ascorbate transporter subunit IIC [Armatimonadota bacterium]MDR7402193.1 PTS ascorbate transporter subunit IIC [Armatimonadota bacterium]MDR7436950.1 PTS ascorbate transporter subunit IIC [Armatimonadota bacterium]MDR7472276.1 PTS ascorbate transporter subunit IIC [Armatimonadota bacterium]MDR7506765.1 PTS ascorbate transporter subunit IIC [Armatimonadota bacterium]